MTHRGHSCRFCCTPQRERGQLLRSSEDVAEYLLCLDYRFPPFLTKLAGIRYGLARLIESV